MRTPLTLADGILWNSFRILARIDQEQMNETVTEETVKIQERVITTKTPDGKTVLTKITTLPGEEIEEIEEETTETIDGETKTNKSKSQVVKAPFPVSKLPNGKEIPIKPNMKVGESTTDYDEETKTTVVTKRLANGYEQAFSTITPEGNNKSWTKTFFDPVPVAGDEEEEEIEEYEEIHQTAATKKKTTTTDKAAVQKNSAPAPVAAKPDNTKKATTTTTAAPEKKAVTTTNTSTVPAPAKPKVTPSEKTVVKNIPHGKQEVTTTVDAQGRETTKIHTMTDLPNEVEEYEEYEETHITEEQPKTKKTTTTTTAVPQKKQTVVAAGTKTSPTTTVAVPGAQSPKDNVLARKVVSKGEEEIQITEERTETEFSPTKKTSVTSTVVPSTGEKLDPKGKTTVNKVVIPGSQSTVTTKSNEQDGKQIVVKKGPSGTQNISKTTAPDGSQKVSVTTTVNPEEINIEETETTNIIGDKTITTTRTEVPIPGKKIVKQVPAQKTEGAGTKTKTTTTTTTMPEGVDRKTTTTKRVDNGTEVNVKTETKDGKTREETRTKFDPIYHPAVSDEEEIEEYEEETQTFAPVKTKTTITSRVPVDASKKKPDAASSKAAAPAGKKEAVVKGNKK